MKTKIRPGRGRGERKAIEVIETALTLPLLALLMFASSQIAHYVHVQTCLKIAGSEAIYAWGKVGGTQEDAEAVFLQHCEALGLVDCELSVYEISEGGANDANDVILVSPRALASSNQLELPLTISLPTTDNWIHCEDIMYRKEANE